MNVRAVVVSLAVALAASPAGADEVVLKNGAVFSGVVREEGDRVRIEVDFGTMTFKRVDVKSITRSDDPLREFELRLKTAGDARSTYELAQWAREKGLATRSNELLKKVVELEPDHAEARKALGYIKLDGKWLEGDELMVARGFVKHRGKWLLRETAEKLKEQETQILIESDRVQAEEKAARMRREIELAKIAVERERIEMEREKCQAFGWWGPAPWRCRCPRGHAFVLPSGPPQPVPQTAPTVVPLTPPSVVPPGRP